ncbi:hypothetical protein C8R47DRAFT_1231140 [Mycena vitilis]|nr:hypothetical protein C8R47DRAFT_1231140 [Mycena vitilis]
MPSGGSHQSSRYLSKPELVGLWINRARHLAQQLHYSTRIAPEEDTPLETVSIIRDAVCVLLQNMVLLGRTSVRFGKAEGEKGDSEFFVPPESTVLFGMAERFVDTYGYHGDDSPLERAILFENLATLHAAMVSSPRYTLTGVDFPNFQLTTQEHEWYGVFDFIKRCQIARAAAPHVVCRGFGDALSRYNPALAPADRYKFEDPSLKDIPTRPNTPAHAKFEAHSPFAFDATVSSVGMAVVASPESDSDKENGGRGPTPVDVASGNEVHAS